jgi:hypothetical protein
VENSETILFVENDLPMLMPGKAMIAKGRV